MFATLQEMDAWYKTKFQDLNNASSKHAQSVRSMREEIAGSKKDVGMVFCPCHCQSLPLPASIKKIVCVCVQILNKQRDLEALKTKNEFLEAQIRDAAERYKKAEADLQVSVGLTC